MLEMTASLLNRGASIDHNRTFFNLNALVTTEMDEKAMAAAAMAGLRRKPEKG